MDQTTFKILDVLSREIGNPISINELTNKIEQSHGSAYYSNIYDKIRFLTKQGITNLETLGKASIVTLNFSNLLTNDLLTEMDLHKKRETLRKRPQLQILLTSIYASFAKSGSIKSMSLINPERNIKLNKAEFLTLLHVPKERHGQILLDDIISIHKTMQELRRRHNMKIDNLILPSNEFLDLLKSREKNPLREMLANRINFLSPQAFWFEIMSAMEDGFQIRFEEKETNPSEISKDSVAYNLARFGYREFGPEIKIKGKDICIEYIITSILKNGDARHIQAIPIILAKNDDKTNYNLLTFLSQKYGTSGKLLGLLKILEKNISTAQIRDAIRILKNIGTEEIKIEEGSITEKLRLYPFGQ